MEDEDFAFLDSMRGDRKFTCQNECDIITHATDSTTRKHMGTFASSGLHINRNEYPTLQSASETTHNISEGIKSTFKMLECASSFPAKELYEKVDVHMTDGYNKGIASCTAQLLDRATPAGQLFCKTHTTLGFDRGIEDINKIESDVNIDNLFKGFLNQ